jgi:hypothetical protein
VSRLPRTETLLVLTCAGAAAMLAASQFIPLFELTPPGGEALAEVDAADQHGYATLVLAAFALVLLVVAITAAGEALAQISAFAVAACGVVALLIFLVGDLPDANQVGTLDDPRESFIDAKAEPQAGFWFELVGALVLAICGAALATLGPEKLNLADFGRRRQGQARSQPQAAEGRSDGGDARRKRGGSWQWPSRSRR